MCLRSGVLVCVLMCAGVCLLLCIDVLIDVCWCVCVGACGLLCVGVDVSFLRIFNPKVKRYCVSTFFSSYQQRKS